MYIDTNLKQYLIDTSGRIDLSYVEKNGNELLHDAENANEVPTTPEQSLRLFLQHAAFTENMVSSANKAGIDDLYKGFSFNIFRSYQDTENLYTCLKWSMPQAAIIRIKAPTSQGHERDWKSKAHILSDFTERLAFETAFACKDYVEGLVDYTTKYIDREEQIYLGICQCLEINRKAQDLWDIKDPQERIYKAESLAMNLSDVLPTLPILYFLELPSKSIPYFVNFVTTPIMAMPEKFYERNSSRLGALVIASSMERRYDIDEKTLLEHGNPIVKNPRSN